VQLNGSCEFCFWLQYIKCIILCRLLASHTWAGHPFTDVPLYQLFLIWCWCQNTVKHFRCHLIHSNRFMFHLLTSHNRCQPNSCRIFLQRPPYPRTNRYVLANGRGRMVQPKNGPASPVTFKIWTGSIWSETTWHRNATIKSVS